MLLCSMYGENDAETIGKTRQFVRYIEWHNEKKKINYYSTINNNKLSTKINTKYIFFQLVLEKGVRIMKYQIQPFIEFTNIRVYQMRYTWYLNWNVVLNIGLYNII